MLALAACGARTPRPAETPAPLPAFDSAVEASALEEAGLVELPTPRDAGVDAAPPPTRAVELVAGADHTCARLDNGAVRCWGDFEHGELGFGLQRRREDGPTAAQDVPLGARALQVAAAMHGTCVVLEGGRLRCWGYNTSDASTRADALEDRRLAAPAALAIVGNEHQCAVLEGGRFRCWGSEQFAQLGPTPNADVPLGAPALAGSAGYSHTCALLQGGSVRCWGVPQLGASPANSELRTVELGAPATQLSSAEWIACALLQGGAVRCWGRPPIFRPQRGPSQATAVRAVRLESPALRIGAGGGRACALLGNGDRYSCWSELALSGEAPVAIGARATAIAVGTRHLCVLLESGGVRCWGDHTRDRLGSEGAASPADVPLLRSAVVPLAR